MKSAVLQIGELKKKHICLKTFPTIHSAGFVSFTIFDDKLSSKSALKYKNEFAI